MAIISTRTTITIGTWNARTMFETGKAAQVAAKMGNYNLTVLGISGKRKQGSPRNTWCCDMEAEAKKMGDNLRGWPRIMIPGELL